MSAVKSQDGINVSQRLELPDSLFPDLMRGAKTDTLRWNEGKIELGYLEFFSAKNPDLTALVIVTGTRKGSMADFAKSNKMTVDQFMATMQKHYPDIKPDAKITQIEFMSPKETAELME
jgi:hypothetical protein